MEQTFDALIVDPDPESRMRLRQATSVCREFREIKFASTLPQALEQLKERLQCNIIFIAQTFASDESQAFVTEARHTSSGQGCAYIMVLNGANQTRTGVATNLTSGMDGFLFQPFSVDALKETTEIASRVKATAKAGKQAASKELLLNSLVSSIDKLADGHLIGKAMRVEKAELRCITRTLIGFYGDDTAGYMEAVTSVFAAVPPPAHPDDGDFSLAARLKRRRLAEQASQNLQGTATSEQRQGGYMMRKR